jgi:hypothetical protein
LAPSYQTTSKFCRIPTSREACSARRGDVAKSARAENEILRCAAAHDLVPYPSLSEAAAVNLRGIGSPLVSNRVLLQAEGLLSILFLHDLCAQIADSVDNAPKRGAHLGLEVAIVEATLFERTLRRFDA